MSKSNKKKETLIIRGEEIMQHKGGFLPPTFKTGPHASEKDRPRDKNWRSWIKD